MLMKTRTEQVDFHRVPAHQDAMDKRLENWAKWCRGTGGSGVHPMFQGCKPAQHWDPIELIVPVDKKDAFAISRAVADLPQHHSYALNWNYVYRTNPTGARKKIGITLEELAELIVNGRQMLINRKV